MTPVIRAPLTREAKVDLARGLAEEYLEAVDCGNYARLGYLAHTMAFLWTRIAECHVAQLTLRQIGGPNG